MLGKWKITTIKCRVCLSHRDTCYKQYCNDTSKYDEYKEKAQMFDTKYQKTAVSIMEQAKEKFLVAFKSINYKQGTATSILSDIMKKC